MHLPTRTLVLSFCRPARLTLLPPHKRPHTQSPPPTHSVGLTHSRPNIYLPTHRIATPRCCVPKACAALLAAPRLLAALLAMCSSSCAQLETHRCAPRSAHDELLIVRTSSCAQLAPQHPAAQVSRRSRPARQPSRDTQKRRQVTRHETHHERSRPSTGGGAGKPAAARGHHCA
jgi:hypothetical protein